MGADEGRKELAKRARQLQKGVTCARVGLVGAAKVGSSNDEDPQLAIWLTREFSEWALAHLL